MPRHGHAVRLAVDIGGTFTDIALDVRGRLHTAKVPTTPREPQRGVLQGVREALRAAAVAPGEVGAVVHGTTLATNALIERKGARTALVTTEGFRDSLEIGYESRYDQYDIFLDPPEPLVPRALRFTVPERMNVRGEVLRPLDEGAVAEVAATLRRDGIESVAIGFLHAYANADHERRTRDILARAIPGLPVSLSSEVCPEVREYERLSTTVANAYVQPAMARYLEALARDLAAEGLGCPLFLMTSGGGMTTLETALRFPIRLVESGPSGGAVLAARTAARLEAPAVVSFDMGGTTAKICLIDGFAADTARQFEVARQARFLKGSGLPIRIPVIDMIEIGAGGGSLAAVDGLGRVTVGPASAGAEPGPACYGRGGAGATVTDADLALGRIDPERFANGAVRLDRAAAEAALAAGVGKALGLDALGAAFAVAEVVDETMANAARVHAVERGKDPTGRTLIAFGGAGPLHAARLAEKLGIARVAVPPDPGVGSAVGFLEAPVSYEIVRSRYLRLSGFDPLPLNALFAELRATAGAVVRAGAPAAELVETRTAFMRYVGQGHEIEVPVPARELGPEDGVTLRRAFDERYAGLYGRTIPDVEIEVLDWALTLGTAPAARPPAPPPARPHTPAPMATRPVFDPDARRLVDIPVHWRPDLAPGARIAGPALILEGQTATLVTARFDARIDGAGTIILARKEEGTA